VPLRLALQISEVNCKKRTNRTTRSLRREQLEVTAEHLEIPRLIDQLHYMSNSPFSWFRTSKRSPIPMCFADVERPSEEVPSFAVAMSAFLKWTAQEHQTSPGTAERYRYSSLALLRFFPSVSLDRINPQEVERFARNAQLGILKGPKKPGGPGPEKFERLRKNRGRFDNQVTLYP
jgi:hypothetical protein